MMRVLLLKYPQQVDIQLHLVLSDKAQQMEKKLEVQRIAVTQHLLLTFLLTLLVLELVFQNKIINLI
jgi:hypothetical protein